MEKIRKNIFETNSSSTHALVIGDFEGKDYAPYGKNLMIRWIDTNEETHLSSLKDKVSYLVSHIASWYKWDCVDYEDLLDEVKKNRDFIRIKEYVKENYNKEIVFPKYDGNIEDIVSINHQLVSWEHSLDEILDDLISRDNRDLLDKVLQNGNYIEIGFD